MNYPAELLGKYIDIISGYAFKSKDFVSSGIPIIKIKNIVSPYVTLDDVVYVDKHIADKLPKYELNYDDVLISLTGSNVNQTASVVGKTGRVKYRQCSMLNQRVGKIVVKEGAECDLDYVYYFLSQEKVKIALARVAGGAANQANISPNDIKNLKIPFPNVETQKRISAMLRNYDDLIENNQKQIKLLEEAAMRLYKEWFVQLRFPGYETMKIVDGVPEGWKKAATKNYIKFNYGKALKAEERTGEGYPVYGSSGIVGYHKTCLVDAPAIIVGRKGNVGSVFFSLENIYPIDTVYYITTNLSLYYTYFELLSRTFVNSDAAVPGLNRTYAESMEMIFPCDRILQEFNNKVSDMLMLRYRLEQQIVLLRQARDKLLPKLMNG